MTIADELDTNRKHGRDACLAQAIDSISKMGDLCAERDVRVKELESGLETATALLNERTSECESLEVEVAKLKEHHRQMMHNADTCNGCMVGEPPRYEPECKELKARVKELEADAARMQWLENTALSLDTVADPDNQVVIWHGTDPVHTSYGKTVRLAVDAAMKGHK